MLHSPRPGIHLDRVAEKEQGQALDKSQLWQGPPEGKEPVSAQNHVFPYIPPTGLRIEATQMVNH